MTTQNIETPAVVNVESDPTWDDIEREYLLAMFARHRTRKATAHATGVSLRKIQQRLLSYGVTPRQRPKSGG